MIEHTCFQQSSVFQTEGTVKQKILLRYKKRQHHCKCYEGHIFCSASSCLMKQACQTCLPLWVAKLFFNEEVTVKYLPKVSGMSYQAGKGALNYLLCEHCTFLQFCRLPNFSRSNTGLILCTSLSTQFILLDTNFPHHIRPIENPCAIFEGKDNTDKDISLPQLRAHIYLLKELM